MHAKSVANLRAFLRYRVDPWQPDRGRLAGLVLEKVGRSEDVGVGRCLYTLTKTAQNSKEVAKLRN